MKCDISYPPSLLGVGGLRDVSRITECRTIEHRQCDDQQDVKPHPVNYDPCRDAVVDGRDVDE